MFYNTNVLNAYQHAGRDRGADGAEYERRYKRYEDAPQPSLVAARMHVELYPRGARGRDRGHVPAREPHRDGRSTRCTCCRAATSRRARCASTARRALVVDDSAQRYRIYALERPLAPGDSIAMTFDVAFRPRGFRNAGAPTDVTPNGAYFDGTWLPGARLLRRPRGAWTRRSGASTACRRARQPPSAGDVETRERAARRWSSWTSRRSSAPTRARSPSRRARSCASGARTGAATSTTAPTRRSASAAPSSPRSTRCARTRGRASRSRVYYHPTHDVNVDRMLRSMQASLAYYSEQFGPYQFRELRVVEFPRYAAFARAHPHTITFSEGERVPHARRLGRRRPHVLRRRARDGAPVVGRAGDPRASVPGAGMVSRDARAVQRDDGAGDGVRRGDGARLLRLQHEGSTSRGRSVYTNREAPLLDVVGQSYVHYFKGAVAMYTLRERLGADAVNGALRRFREKYAGPDAPPATSRALYAELQAVTPDSLRPLLSDLFEHITLWDVRTDSVRAEPDGAGAWRVTLYVDASKARADSVGRQTPIPMDDLVEVGVFAERAGKRAAWGSRCT